MKGILDNELLDGVHEISIGLRPYRTARLVPNKDVDMFVQQATYLCQIWGGGASPIVPSGADDEIPNEYRALLDRENVDGVVLATPPDLVATKHVQGHSSLDYPALLVAASRGKDKYAPFRVPELDVGDPWRPIYAATLGALPAVPDPALGKPWHLLPDLAFEDVLPVHRERVEGSMTDLLARLEDPRVAYPRVLSLMFLASGWSHRRLRFGARGILPEPRRTLSDAGPNVVVVVGEGVVEDLALLWNLRGAHGLQHPLPVGIPSGLITQETLNLLKREHRIRTFSAARNSLFVTSASIDLAELKAFDDPKNDVEVVDHRQLLTFGPVPSRSHTQAVIWQAGKARIRPETEADAELIRYREPRPPEMLVDFEIDGERIPASRAMRGGQWGPRFQAGRAQVQFSMTGGEKTTEVSWPSTWTMLAAVAKDHGLRVQRSSAGLAAETLLNSIGNVTGTYWLAHEPLIALLYRLAERSGMSWFRKRWSSAHAELLRLGTNPEGLAKLEDALGRDEPVIAPPGEGRSLPFSEFRQALGRNSKAAEHWINWAERHHLVVRGADMQCPFCMHEDWLPMSSVPPPVACAGCGRQVSQPYGAQRVDFTYRIGEVLRRVLESDALGHVLAIRWLSTVLERHGLVGAHPGVEFIDESGQTVGEADVVLLFSDGALALGEVKRRLAGADAAAVDKLDELVRVTEASWSFLAVMQAESACEGLKAYEASDAPIPRFTLTLDHLVDPHPVFSLGGNPFAWGLESAADRKRTDPSTTFVRSLAARDPDTEWDVLAHSILQDED